MAKTSTKTPSGMRKARKGKAATRPAAKIETKQDTVLAMLRRQTGASIPEIVDATGWQPHSVRGFLTAAVKKRLGISVISEKGEDGVRRYYVVRAHWMIPKGPILNLTEIIEEAGIVVAHSNMGGSSISGVTFRVPGVPPLIVLNNEQPADRMRHTLAHELAHVIMHRFPTATMEKEADEFASCFLAPTMDIKHQ